MKHQTVFKLSVMAGALAVALVGHADVMHDHGGPALKKLDDGKQDKTTNVSVRDWSEPKPKAPQPTAKLEGAALKAEPARAADIAVPPLPQGKPGECCARAWIPPQYEMRLDRRIKQPAGERFEVIPTRYEYEKVMDKGLAKEASQQIEAIKAVYGTVTERVVVKPAYTKFVAIPATYDTITE
jgi:hypothetical protein